MLQALIFDMDGTLADTNPAHAEAWQQSFAERGFKVSLDETNGQIGKGGDGFVIALLGEEGEAEHGEALRHGHTDGFIERMNSRKTPVFDGALELLERAKASGLKVALATSSKNEELDAIERSTGVAWRDQFDVVATNSDAKNSKPAPDLLLAALDKLQLPASACALLGDTVYDAQAAKRAGVIMLGVRTGPPQVSDEAGFREEGARLAFADLREVLARFDEIRQLT